MIVADADSTSIGQHLLGIEELSADQITAILDLAEHYREKTNRGTGKLDDLRGIVVANLFFEPSTRTRTSFNLAARRIGADTVDFSAGGSSLSKGETFVDTALTIEAMGVDLVVCRHRSLLEHFGQVLDEGSCEACDVCLGDLDLVDDRAGGIEAQEGNLVKALGKDEVDGPAQRI